MVAAVSRSLVSVVDDDESVRESLPDLLRAHGYTVEAFSSGEAFLASSVITTTSVLILDVSMPGMSGHDVQRELTRLGHQIPIVFISAHQDDAALVPPAVARLAKPFSEAALLAALDLALEAR
jgi:FixJ family two-component response regulator